MTVIGNEIQAMLNELRNDGLPPLEDTDFTRDMIANEFHLSPNGAKNRAKKMVNSGKWIMVMKRAKTGNPVATYKRVE